MYRSGAARHVVPGSVFGALTVLSHPDWAWFLAYSLALLWIALGRDRRLTLYSAVLAAGILCLSAPWWLMVLTRYGLSTMQATVSGNSAVWPWFTGLEQLPKLEVTDEIGLPVLSALALLGVLVCLARRRYLLPIWLCLALGLSSRAPTDRAAAVVGLLVGVGIAEAVLPLLTRGLPGQREGATPTGMGNEGRLAAGVLALLLLRTVVATWAREDIVAYSLPPAQRAAMELDLPLDPAEKPIRGHRVRPLAFGRLRGRMVSGAHQQGQRQHCPRVRVDSGGVCAPLPRRSRN